MSSPVDAGVAVGGELELLDAAIANDDVADLALAVAPRWLLPAGELYATSQAAPNTERTYRCTLRSFALFVQAQLGLAPTIDALVLSTVLDYKRYLQADDPATGRPARAARDRRQTALRATRLRALAVTG